jgi:hypothetical protein
MAAEKTPERKNNINKSTVVRHLKEEGPCPKSLALLDSWIQQKQALIDNRKLTRVGLAVMLADLWRDAGYAEQACDAYTQVIDILTSQYTDLESLPNIIKNTRANKLINEYLNVYERMENIWNYCASNREALNKTLDS